MERTRVIAEAQLQAQKDICRQIKEYWQEKGIAPLAFVDTYGCQQNEADSERIRGMLRDCGYEMTDTEEGADVIVLNTCAIREHAEQRVFGNVGALVHTKRRHEGQKIFLCGCMMGQEHVAKKIKSSYTHVDGVFNPHQLWRFPELLHQVLKTGKRVFATENEAGNIAEGIPVVRQNKLKAWVSIMYGCNNFCSYCIVPYVRGRERSRDPQDILDEVKRLQDKGAKEIMLLGQNVNSYRGGGAEFANLLRGIDEMGVDRIRFMTSHPKDLSDELIAAYGELKHLMPALHLPVQAGNNEILRQMNRRYTRERYLDLVSRLRKVCPDIGLTSDIIVGFPGETEEQFEDTMSLVKEVRFDASYTFIYSPRVGTKAAAMPDPVSADEKSARIQRLIELQQSIGYEVLLGQVGRRETVLVESVSARDENSVGGKTPRGHMVNFPGNAELIGKFVEVEITSAGKNTLRGKRIQED